MKSHKITRAVSLLLMVVMAIGMVACSSDPVATTGLSVETSGVKTSVTISTAKDYSTSGLAVYAEQSDGSKVLLSADQYTVDASAVTGATATGTYAVKVSGSGATVITGITGISASYDVTVTADTFTVDTTNVPASASVQSTALDTWFAENVTVKDTSGNALTYGTGYTLSHTLNSDGTITFKATSASDGTYVEKIISGVTVLYTGSLTVSLEGLSDDVTVKIIPDASGAVAQTISNTNPSVSFSDINVGSYSFTYAISDSSLYEMTGYSVDGGSTQTITDATVPFTINSGVETKVALEGRYFAGTATFSVTGATILEGTKITVSMNDETLEFTKDDTAEKLITNLLKDIKYTYTVTVTDDTSIYGYSVDTESGDVTITTDGETVAKTITGSYQYGAINFPIQAIPDDVTVIATLMYKDAPVGDTKSLTNASAPLAFTRVPLSDGSNYYSIVYALDETSEPKYKYNSSESAIAITAGNTETAAGPQITAAKNSVTFKPAEALPDGVTVSITVNGTTKTITGSGTAVFTDLTVADYTYETSVADTNKFDYKITNTDKKFSIYKDKSTEETLTGSSTYGYINGTISTELELTEGQTVTVGLYDGTDTDTQIGDLVSLTLNFGTKSVDYSFTLTSDITAAHTSYIVKYSYTSETYELSATDSGTISTAGLGSIVACTAVTLQEAGNWYTKGVDAGNKFKIGTVEELVQFANAVNGVSNPIGDGTTISDTTFANSTISLTADISLDTVDNWTPIGSSNSYPFKGTFTGRKDDTSTASYTISNLTISNSNMFVGLFGYLGSGSNVEYLTIETANVTSTSTNSWGGYVGTLAGMFEGTKISNVSVTNSTVTIGTSNTLCGAGGLVGLTGSSGSTISDVTVSTSTVTGARAGGVVGEGVGPISSATVANVNVEGSYYASGVVGYYASNNTISGCSVSITNTSCLILSNQQTSYSSGIAYVGTNTSGTYYSPVFTDNSVSVVDNNRIMADQTSSTRCKISNTGARSSSGNTYGLTSGTAQTASPGDTIS